MKSGVESRRLRNQEAFNVLELMLVLLVLAVLIGLLLPAFARPRGHPAGWRCVYNLKQVGLAFRIWAGDNHDRYPMKCYLNEDGTPKEINNSSLVWFFQVMSNELNTPKVLCCDIDRERTSATNFSSDFGVTNLSYFVGLDADETMPTMFLAGDRNLTNGAALTNQLMLLNSNQPVAWTKAMHKNMGNVVLADGSVQRASNLRIKTMVAETGTNLNRLLFP